MRNKASTLTMVLQVYLRDVKRVKDEVMLLRPRAMDTVCKIPFLAAVVFPPYVGNSY